MSLFSNTANTAQSGTGTGGGSIFGANTGATGSTASASLFGNPAKPTNSLFGGNTTSNPQPSGTSLFGAAAVPATGGLFGGSSTNTTAPAAPSNPAPFASNSIFGGGGFSLPKPTDQANKDAPKPGTSSFFSNPTSTSTSTAAPTLNTGLFGSTPKPAEGTATTAGTPAGSSMSTTALGSSLFGGGMFGKPATATTATTSPTTATTPAPSFSLGGAAATSIPAASTSTTVPTTTPGGGLFGAKPSENNAPAALSLFGAKSEEKKGAEAATALSKPGEKAGGLLGTSALGSSTVPAVAVLPPSVLRGKTIEEIVNKWSNELETHIKEFNKFAAEVSTWDRALIENSKSLGIIYSHVVAAEREQAEVDQSLDHIEQQQRDLAATLDAYEKVTEEIFGGQGGSLRALDTGPADTERDKNYMLATDLQTHLDDLSGSLTQMIDAVNGLSMPSAGGKTQEDPMAQISQILSSHLDSLQWIDGAVREIDSKVADVERRVNESGQSLNGNGVKSRGYRT
ncbi:hypothetical protein D9757_000140 [Collybiopsis confluens]|uniref:Nucleoporin NSP1 n=1 Tax=Collybiopsis confluens TaxID=2823264 RepID=A0A8H5I3D7_9AGAR|nr:hypothetical protein D9757_000140 [Collybiopsis confluens]